MARLKFVLVEIVVSEDKMFRARVYDADSMPANNKIDGEPTVHYVFDQVREAGPAGITSAWELPVVDGVLLVRDEQGPVGDMHDITVGLRVPSLHNVELEVDIITAKDVQLSTRVGELPEDGAWSCDRSAMISVKDGMAVQTIVIQSSDGTMVEEKELPVHSAAHFVAAERSMRPYRNFTAARRTAVSKLNF